MFTCLREQFRFRIGWKIELEHVVTAPLNDVLDMIELTNPCVLLVIFDHGPA